MILEIKPLIGIGDLRFGMSVDEARAALGPGFRSFKRSPLSTFPGDSWREEGVFVYYAPPGILEAVEVSQPSQAILMDVDLLTLSFSATDKLIRELDPMVDADEDGLTSRKLGIGVYAPDADEPQVPVQGVIVFQEGYYDQ